MSAPGEGGHHDVDCCPRCGAADVEVLEPHHACPACARHAVRRVMAYELVDLPGGPAGTRLTLTVGKN